MSWVALRAAIKTNLDTLVPSTLGSVYNGEQPPANVEITAWPAAELVRIQTNPEYLTNREDIQDYIFAVNIYQELHEDDYHTVEIAGDAIVDAVMQLFLSDASLGGAADARIRPISAGAAVTSWIGKPCRRDTVFLACRKVMSM